MEKPGTSTHRLTTVRLANSVSADINN